MTWKINYKGLTGHQGTLAEYDETSATIADVISDIKDDETGSNSSTVIDGPDSLTYADCYDKFYVSRNTSLELTALTGSDTIDQHLVDGDVIVCTPLDGTNGTANKRVRQQVKLGIAQLKRKALMSGSPSSEPFYRTNNTYEWDNLPTTYNTDGSINDNPNDGGLVPYRPWNTALGVAGVDVSGLTLASGLSQRLYTTDYFGSKTTSSVAADQAAYDTFFGGSPASTLSTVTELSKDGTVGATDTYTLLGYFKPDVTGTWSFRIRSDDASYLFLGDAAEVTDNDTPSGSLLADAVVKNYGLHAAQNATGSFYLVADSYYYLYAIFGNNTGPGTALFYYTKPGESENTDGTGGVSDFDGLVFYNTATDGQ